MAYFDWTIERKFNGMYTATTIHNGYFRSIAADDLSGIKEYIRDIRSGAAK